MEISNLDNLLVEDLTWRKLEISELITLAEVEEKNVLLKSIILLLYAHWEGYVKKSSKTYLKFVIENRIMVSELTDNFKYVALKGLSKEVHQSSTTLNLMNDIKFVLKLDEINTKTIDQILRVDINNEREKTIVDTQDNLTPEIFKKIIAILGLTYLDGYELKKMQIENKLVAYRNSIGHGNRKLSANEDFQLEINKIKELKEIIFTIIENFREDIFEYAKEQFFLKENKSQIASYVEMKELKLQQEFWEIESRYTNEQTNRSTRNIENIGFTTSPI